MKAKWILGAAAAATVLAICMPMHAQMMGHSPAAQAANDPSRNGMTSSTMNMDKEFLMKSAQASQNEIAAAQAALQKSSNDDVKQFAQKMIDDHKAWLEKETPAVQAMGLTAPTRPDKATQKMIEKMGSLSGAAFDKAYIKAQVTAHKEAVALFDKEISTGSNDQVKQLAQDGKPVIASHLQMAEDLNNKMMAMK